MIPMIKLTDGNEIPIIGFGTWQLEKKSCVNSIKMALEIGYRHIDTAYIYNNQEYVKEGIKAFPRENLFIASKLWRDHLKPNKVAYECDITLKQLGVDYLDLYLVHWPDSSVPLHATVEAMLKLKEKGKIKSIGVSNCTIHHLQDLIDKGIEVVNNQVEYHPYLNQEKLFKFCKKHQISLTAYSPLAHGEVFKDEGLFQIGKKYNKTAGQVSLRWLIQKNIIVIPKGSSKEHIKENFEIFDFELSNEDMFIIDQICHRKNIRQIKPVFNEFDY
jgi:2,5-diketo-D-gluconate reductase B